MTNWVMAEIAQPMHAFDADKLRDRIRVRSACAGEQLAALNGETYTLSRANLVIADDSGAIALAGVIGGAASAISASTKRIVLESACFHAGSVRKTSSALKLRTDASMRFEKAQDPAQHRAWSGTGSRVAPKRFARQRGLRRSGRCIRAASNTAADYDSARLAESEARARCAEGTGLSDPRIARSSPSLRNSRAMLRVRVPSWRATKDVSIKDDLVEEVGRMIGYARFRPPRRCCRRWLR